VAEAGRANAPVKKRLEAIAQMPDIICEDAKSFQTAVKLLKDRKQPIQVRLAALQALQAASFGVIAFEDCRSDYVDALRSLVDDPDHELRQRVLGTLSRQKDPVAQERLIEGLRHPDQALLPPEKALQLLGNDIHTEAYAEARKIVEHPPNTAAKREAIRLLASDASSTPILEKVLRDKDEAAEVRQVSAAALNTINPEALQKHAREMLMDKKEYPEIQATSLTALNQFGAPASAQDRKLRDRIDTLADSDSEVLQESARSFKNKYGD
jgi:HEAT repeat protein